VPYLGEVMDRHLADDWAILKDTDYPEYIRLADATWLGNHLSGKVLRRLRDTARYANLEKSSEIPDRELRKAIEKACSLISRKAHTYAQYKFGSMAHPHWYEKEKLLLSDTQRAYYFYGTDKSILSDKALYCRDYCAKIVRFMSDILEVEMFLRDHSNRHNTSLFIRMNTEMSEIEEWYIPKEAKAEIDIEDKYVHEEPDLYEFRLRHKDCIITSTVLFKDMWEDYEHDVAVIW
jgi:hypothetical protein